MCIPLFIRILQAQSFCTLACIILCDCLTLFLAVVVIGYAPVLYTVNENDRTGEVEVTIRLLQGDLTGLTASTAIPVDVSAASFTATGQSV